MAQPRPDSRGRGFLHSELFGALPMGGLTNRVGAVLWKWQRTCAAFFCLATAPGARRISRRSGICRRYRDRLVRRKCPMADATLDRPDLRRDGYNGRRDRAGAGAPATAFVSRRLHPVSRFRRSFVIHRLFRAARSVGQLSLSPSRGRLNFDLHHFK